MEGNELRSGDLAGATILAAGEVEEYGSRWPTLTLRTRSGRFLRLIVSRDEEGNGPGALAFEEVGREEAEAAEAEAKANPTRIAG